MVSQFFKDKHSTYIDMVVIIKMVWPIFSFYALN